MPPPQKAKHKGGAKTDQIQQKKILSLKIRLGKWCTSEITRQ